MARIGRNVTIDVNFEQFVDKYLKWVPNRPRAGIDPEPYIAKLSPGKTQPLNIDIYGEVQDLNDLKSKVESRNVVFTVNGAAVNPEPTPEPDEPGPDYDPAIVKQAVKNIIQAKVDALQAELQTEYTNLGGTGTLPNYDWKHYRWAL